MQLRKYRWSRAYESAEEELLAVLAAKKITAVRWIGEESQVVPPVQLPHDVQLWCAEGMLTLRAGDQAYSLQPGDIMDLPAGTTYSLEVRFGGCVCYESSPSR
jgi:quercetin dioxygenase-like cupin family protein